MLGEGTLWIIRDLSSPVGFWLKLSWVPLALLAAEVSATRTPDVLIVSIESLRADQLTAEQMPNLYKASAQCLRLENHYSTSNNTGGGLFGLLTGMTGYYYQHARQRWMKPLPLEQKCTTILNAFIMMSQRKTTA